MRLLLDTHAFLWFAADSPELSNEAKSLLENVNNDLFLSYVSLWEIGIKVSLGKLSVPQPFDAFISTQLSLNDIELLPLSIAQISTVVTLPFHHRDPFDRLLAAQSMVEDLPLVSRDEIFDVYAVKRLW
ncbi:MAG: PIN domain-containing protein [Chloroflexi bacterium]|nr:PIN domain-containing protein [Chloroflexota bacterium]